jgi:hypothetical protein
MSTQRFGDLPIGSRFCFRAHRYEKVTTEIGRDEERGGNVFHANTEVLAEMALAGGRHAECRVRSGPPLTPCPSPAGRGAVVPAARRPVRMFVRSRLGRSPDRELRPYGTV